MELILQGLTHMKVVLIRHLKVIVRRRFFVTGAQFDDHLVLYDDGDIAKTEFKIKPEDFPVCFASSKKRAVETAKLIYAGTIAITDDLIEVKSATNFLRWLHLPAALRSTLSRLAWYFNYSRMPETRHQSKERANKFVAMLLSGTQEDTLIVSHGFFMHSLKDALKDNGFKGKLPLFPKNGHPYGFERD